MLSLVIDLSINDDGIRSWPQIEFTRKGNDKPEITISDETPDVVIDHLRRVVAAYDEQKQEAGQKS